MLVNSSLICRFTGPVRAWMKVICSWVCLACPICLRLVAAHHTVGPDLFTQSTKQISLIHSRSTEGPNRFFLHCYLNVECFINEVWCWWHDLLFSMKTCWERQTSLAEWHVESIRESRWPPADPSQGPEAPSTYRNTPKPINPSSLGISCS